MNNYTSITEQWDTVDIEQHVARWFAGAHKTYFGNGPQDVYVVYLRNRFIIVASKVLNKFEISLLNVADGKMRVNYTRKLLFDENKSSCKISFQESTGIPVKDLRYKLNVEADKSLCIIIC